MHCESTTPDDEDSGGGIYSASGTRKKEETMVYIYRIILGVGAFAMYGVMVTQCKYYSLSPLKCLWITILLTISGVIGAKLMYYIESGGSFEGESFYGAVFFAPLLMGLVAYVCKASVWKVLDLCAPAECIMLAILKIRCAIAGCCGGRLLWVTEQGQVHFPSQIVETFVALLLMVVLLVMMKKGRQRGKIYGVYLILYGTTRFLLNTLRDTTAIVGWLAIGHIWSIVSVLVGVLWLLHSGEKKKVMCNEKMDK